MTIEKLAMETYGEGVTLEVNQLGNGIAQLVVLHPAGVPLLVVTARSGESAKRAAEAAMSVVKSEG